jgi:hypothetical protein
VAFTELNHPIPVLTPKGKAICHWVIDYGFENDLVWVCVIRDGQHTGEIWSYNNADIRVEHNVTALRFPKEQKDEA